MDAYLTEAVVIELARADWPNLTNLSIGNADLDVMSVDADMLQIRVVHDILDSVITKKTPVYHDRGMVSLPGHDLGLWPNLRWIQTTDCGVQFFLMRAPCCG